MKAGQEKILKNPKLKLKSEEREINHIEWTPTEFANYVLEMADGKNPFNLIVGPRGNFYFGHKEIIQSTKRDKILHDIYYSLQDGLCGADILFKRVNEKYLGITQKYTRMWLHEQELAQRFK